MITYDNSSCKIKEEYLDDLRLISDVRIDELSLDDNPNLLIFPRDMKQYGDKIYENQVFSIRKGTLHTGNIMGFVGINKSELTIKSRFAKNCKQDYFLHYMLQKVFCINLFDLKRNTEEENVFDFILYMFPYFLKKALNQGLFKCYQERKYNDANVKGRIDVNRHIKENTPFRGGISYMTREHRYDNHITQLIRHTIEFIRQHPLGSSILHNDPYTLAAVSQIIYATPTYDRNSRTSVINHNIRPLYHPFFFEYSELQQLCLRILRYEGLKYGDKKDQVYGILFDGAWLWEEYLNTILKDCDFIHPQNNTQTKPIYLFESCKAYRRYPDFYKKDVVLDAKYKKFNSKDGDKIDRNDMHQLITYMHILKSNNGGFVFPIESNNEHTMNVVQPIGELNGCGGFVKLIGMNIPLCDVSKGFKSFIQLMKERELNLTQDISELC